jgi:hypothetical protein
MAGISTDSLTVDGKRIATDWRRVIYTNLVVNNATSATLTATNVMVNSIVDLSKIIIYVNSATNPFAQWVTINLFESSDLQGSNWYFSGSNYFIQVSATAEVSASATILPVTSSSDFKVNDIIQSQGHLLRVLDVSNGIIVTEATPGIITNGSYVRRCAVIGAIPSVADKTGSNTLFGTMFGIPTNTINYMWELYVR